MYAILLLCVSSLSILLITIIMENNFLVGQYMTIKKCISNARYSSSTKYTGGRYLRNRGWLSALDKMEIFFVVVCFNAYSVS